MTSHGDTVLMVAVRPRVVLKYLGQVLLVFAGLSAVPLAASLAVGEAEFALRLGILVAATLTLSAPLSRLQTPRQIQWNEALCVTALAFLLTPLGMSGVLAVDGIPLVDAWFEAVSGVTTTGLSTLGTVDGLSPLFLFTRAWTQWYGGLGIAVLSVALIMRHHASSRRLLESSGGAATAETAGTHARRVFAVYLALTLAGILLVWAVQGEAFVATTHALAAVSTGGFSVFDDSLADMPVTSRAAVMLLCLLGAVSLPLYYRARHDGIRVLLREPELKALVLATLAVSGAIGLLLYAQGGLPWGEALGHGLLLGASAQTTAGFSGLDVAALAPATQLVLIFAMFTGGCSGSTAGGVKLVRVLVLLRLIQLALRRTAAPARAVMRTHLGGEPLGPDVVANTLLLIGLWGLVVTASWLPFLVYGYDPLSALFEVVSATGTVGLSAGISSPHLETPLKVVLGLDMLFGRVEIIALLVVLYPPTWLGRRRRNQ